jgi:hypothetical protein
LETLETWDLLELLGSQEELVQLDRLELLDKKATKAARDLQARLVLSELQVLVVSQVGQVQLGHQEASDQLELRVFRASKETRV